MIKRIENGLELQGSNVYSNVSLVNIARQSVVPGLIMSLFFFGFFFLRAWLVLTVILVPLVWLLLKVISGKSIVLFDDAERILRRGRLLTIPYDRIKSITIFPRGDRFNIVANKRIGLVEGVPETEMREVKEELERRFSDVRTGESNEWKLHIIMAGVLIAVHIIYVFMLDVGRPPALVEIDISGSHAGDTRDHVIDDFILSLSSRYISKTRENEQVFIDKEVKCLVSEWPEFHFSGNDIESWANSKILSFVVGIENNYDVLNMAIHSDFGFIPLFLRAMFFNGSEVAYEFESDFVQGLLTTRLVKGVKTEVLAVEGKGKNMVLSLSGFCKEKESTVLRDMAWSIRPK